jgi:hypothetical protein
VPSQAHDRLLRRHDSLGRSRFRRPLLHGADYVLVRDRVARLLQELATDLCQRPYG